MLSEHIDNWTEKHSKCLGTNKLLEVWQDSWKLECSGHGTGIMHGFLNDHLCNVLHIFDADLVRGLLDSIKNTVLVISANMCCSQALTD